MQNQSAANQSVGQTPPHLAGNIPKPISEQSAPPTQTPSPSGPEALRAGGKRKIIIILIVLVLVAAIAGYLFYLSRQPKPAAQVGSEEISHEAVANFARDCDLAQKEAVEYLADEKVLSKWADDEKITLTQDQQKAEEIRISGKEATINCIATQAKVNLLREKLSSYTADFHEGKFISINFGLYANPNPIQVTGEATREADRIPKLKEDRNYADTLVNSVYSDLKEGRLTFEEAMEKVKNDPRVGTKSPYETSLQSGQFIAKDYKEKKLFFNNDSIREKVDKLKENETSEPFIHQVDVSFCEKEDADCKPQYVDSRWLIVRVEKIGKDYEETGEKLLAKIRNKYDAKVFLK